MPGRGSGSARFLRVRGEAADWKLVEPFPLEVRRPGFARHPQRPKGSWVSWVSGPGEDSNPEAVATNPPVDETGIPSESFPQWGPERAPSWGLGIGVVNLGFRAVLGTPHHL